MDKATWLEGLAIICAAVAMVVIGHFIGEPTLAGWGGVVFGVGVGYLGHGARQGQV